MNDEGVWRGRIEQRAADHERRLDAHGKRLTTLTDAIGTVREELASLKAKVMVAAAAGSILGGAVVAIVIQVLFR